MIVEEFRRSTASRRHFWLTWPGISCNVIFAQEGLPLGRQSPLGVSSIA
jgi:hypothetical protein